MSDKSKKRENIPGHFEAEVIYSSDFTCCVCQIKGKHTQIHHIDGEPSNNDLENLALLCLECHNDTQIKGGFGRKLTSNIVITYRHAWYKIVEDIRRQVKENKIKQLSEGKISVSNSLEQERIEVNNQEIETVESNDEQNELIRSICRDLGIKRTMLDFQEVFSIVNKSEDKTLNDAKIKINKWAYDIVNSFKKCGVDIKSIEIQHEDYLFKINGNSFWIEVNTKPDATSDSYPNSKAIRSQLSWDRNSSVPLSDFLKNLNRPYYAIAYELLDEIDVCKMKKIVENSSGFSFRGEGTRNGQLNQIEYEIVQGLRFSIRRYYDIDKREGGFLTAWDTTSIKHFWKLHEYLSPTIMFYIMIGLMTPKQVMKIFDLSRIAY
jgi:hypothetical protein